MNSIKPMRAILFARVSQKSQEEEGYSLPSQIKLLKEYAVRNKFEVVDLVSVPESGSETKARKLFNGMLDRLDKDKTITRLEVEKVDRLSRNFRDALKLDDWLRADETRQIHFVKQNLVIHKNSKSHEILQWDMYLVFAKNYVNNLREEVAKGTLAKAEEGWYPGSRKVGYKSSGEHGKKTWIIDDEKADFIKKAFDWAESGLYSVREISKKLKDLGWYTNGQPLGKNYLHKVLRDVSYASKEFMWNGKHYYDAKHEPIISRDVFDKVQDFLSGRRKTRFRTHNFVYGNTLISCGECGHSVTPEKHTKDSGLVFNYYRCHQCKQKSITESRIQEQLIDRLTMFEVKSPRLIEWTRKALKAYRSRESTNRDTNLATLQTQLVATNKKRDELLDKFIEEKINKEMYDRGSERYNGEVKFLTDSIKKQQEIDSISVDVASNIFELALKARHLYLNVFGDEDKRRFINLLSSNFFAKDKKIDIAYINGFESLEKRPIAGEIESGAREGI